MKGLLKVLLSAGMIGAGVAVGDYVYDTWINDRLPASLQFNNPENVAKGKRASADAAIYWTACGLVAAPVVIFASKLTKQESPIKGEASLVK